MLVPLPVCPALVQAQVSVPVTLYFCHPLGRLEIQLEKSSCRKVACANDVQATNQRRLERKQVFNRLEFMESKLSFYCSEGASFF